jgi:hypothetical protein
MKRLSDFLNVLDRYVIFETGEVYDEHLGKYIGYKTWNDDKFVGWGVKLKFVDGRIHNIRVHKLVGYVYFGWAGNTKIGYCDGDEYNIHKDNLINLGTWGDKDVFAHGYNVVNKNLLYVQRLWVDYLKNKKLKEHEK